jgi:hypothetical protein
MLKKDGRDLIADFRRLAPQRRPIALQRWGLRRVGVAAGMFAAIALAVIASVNVFVPVHNVPVLNPECGTNDTMILAAQALPDAELLPCVGSLPTGWTYGMTHIHRGGMEFSLDSDQAGVSAVSVALSATCDTSGAVATRSTEPGTRRFDLTRSIDPTYEGTRFYTFGGGCVRYGFRFVATAPHARALDVERGLTFMERRVLVDHVQRTVRLPLCGRGATCPG